LQARKAEGAQMDWIPWDDTLMTGYAKIDADHKALADQFNLLADAVEKRAGDAAYASLLEGIIERAEAHFDLEERLMAEHAYPKLDQHRAEHAMLVSQARNYRATFARDAAQSPVAVAHFPEVWLAFHILFSDKELAEYLARIA
jgi:hemerythrin